MPELKNCLNVLVGEADGCILSELHVKKQLQFTAAGLDREIGTVTLTCPENGCSLRSQAVLVAEKITIINKSFRIDQVPCYEAE